MFYLIANLYACIDSGENTSSMFDFCGSLYVFLVVIYSIKLFIFSVILKQMKEFIILFFSLL